MHTAVPLPAPCKPAPWNEGRLIGQKRPLKPKGVWAIRVRLQLQGRKRDLALLNLAIDSKRRGGGLVRLQVDDVCAGGWVRDRGSVIQKKTGRPAQFEITEQTRASIRDWLLEVELRNGRYLFPSPTAPLYPAIRSHRPCLGREGGARHFSLWHPPDASNESSADLQVDRQSQSRAVAAGAHEARKHRSLSGDRGRCCSQHLRASRAIGLSKRRGPGATRAAFFSKDRYLLEKQSLSPRHRVDPFCPTAANWRSIAKRLSDRLAVSGEAQPVINFFSPCKEGKRKGSWPTRQPLN
jgi:hypothetical protein